MIQVERFNKSIDVFRTIGKFCRDKNVEFYYFVDKQHKQCEYIGSHKTFLKLKCLNCGNVWYESYHDVMFNHGCSVCGKKSSALKRRNNIEKVLNNINNKCIENNYEFLGFCNKNGEDSEYLNTKIFLKLRCNNCGYVWNTTTYGSFIRGVKCKNCKKKIKSVLEEEISILLKCNDIEFIRNERKILYGLELDFYLPKYNIAIECQGIQHFKSLDKENEELKKFVEKQKNIDRIKKKLCSLKGIKLLYYSNLHIKYPYKVYEDINEIMEIIKLTNETSNKEENC